MLYEPRRAGSLINRPVTFRTKTRFWHPRTGCTAFLLLLSATAVLVIINLIPQRDPYPNPQLARHGHDRLPRTFSGPICGGKHAPNADLDVRRGRESVLDARPDI